MLTGMLGKCSGCAREMPAGMMPLVLGVMLEGCSGSAPWDDSRDFRGMLADCSPACTGIALRAARGVLTEVLERCWGLIFVLLPGKYAGAPGSLVVCAPRYLEDAPGMLGRCRDARGRCPGCSRGPGGAHRLSRGVLGCCWGLAVPAAPVRLRAPRSAPLRAPRRGWRSGGAGGRRRGGEGVVSPARLSRRPGSINEIIMQKKQPSATRQPYLIPAGGEVGRGWVPGPLYPGGAGTGLAVPIRLAFPVRGPYRHPPPAGHPGWARVGTADGLCQEHPGSAAPPPCLGTLGDPSRPGAVLPGWVQGDRTVGGQETEPGRLWLRGWARGWHGVARGESRAFKHTREGPGILNCIADKSPT